MEHEGKPEGVQNQTLNQLIPAARAGDMAALSELVRRYQNLAFSHAYSMLHDFQHAEDVTQEAFITVLSSLDRLQEVEAFSAWLRGIVQHQCHRLLRRPQLETIPLDATLEVVAFTADPACHIEQQEIRRAVRAAIADLPPLQREVTTLFYLQERSQPEIAVFLDVPLSTVNTRLHAARQKLKRRMTSMMEDTLTQRDASEEPEDNVGRIIHVRGPVIEARFPDPAPDCMDVLLLATNGGEPSPGEHNVHIDVVQRRPNGVVCGVATPGHSLTPGMKVVNTKQIGACLSTEELEWTVSYLGSPPPAQPEIIETGIKVVDLLCPLVTGGRVGVFGPDGTGTLVLIEELGTLWK